MKVTLNMDYCIASGACVLECPEVFAQHDDGTVVLLQAEPPASLHDQTRRAAAICPTKAIEIEES
jgi:ferredoxin